MADLCQNVVDTLSIPSVSTKQACESDCLGGYKALALVRFPLRETKYKGESRDCSEARCGLRATGLFPKRGLPFSHVFGRKGPDCVPDPFRNVPSSSFCPPRKRTAS